MRKALGEDADMVTQPGWLTERQPHPRERGRLRSVVSPAVALLIAIGTAACTGSTGETSPADPTTAVATSGALTTELRLSTNAPSSRETITAEVTVTNGGSNDAVVPAACGTTVFVRADPSADVALPTGSTALGVESQAQSEKEFGVFTTERSRPVLTVSDLTDLIGADATRATQELTGCGTDDGTTELAPGESLVVRQELTVGELGLTPGPGAVATKYFGTNPPPDVELPLTIPERSSDRVTRATAIDAALALPEIRERIATLEQVPPPTSVVVSSPRAPEDPLRPSSPVEQFPSLFVAWPADDGWQIGYADPSGAFLVRVAADGTAAVVGIR